jgi:hypothetical protein
MRNFIPVYFLISIVGCHCHTHQPLPVAQVGQDQQLLLPQKNFYFQEPSHEWCEKNVPRDGRPMWQLSNEYANLCPEEVLKISNSRLSHPLLPIPTMGGKWEEYHVPSSVVGMPPEISQESMYERREVVIKMEPYEAPLPPAPQPASQPVQPATTQALPTNGETREPSPPAPQPSTRPVQSTVPLALPSGGGTWGNSYVRKDGKRVKGHRRRK